MQQVVTYRVFGEDARPTIYYLVGHTNRIDQYSPHIKLLARVGFRVVAFEYNRSILDKGDPALLVGSLKRTVAEINKDKHKRPVAGIFGVSLGAWLGLNVLTMTDIEVGYYLCGGVNMVDAIWSKPLLAVAKQAFIANGFTKSTLHKAMRGYDFNEHSPNMLNKRYVLAISTHDEVIDFAEASRNFKSWQKTNPDSRLIVYKRYNHWQAIVRGLVSVRSTVSFFAK